MPLSVATMTTEVLRLTDATRGDFVGFPAVVVGGVVDLPATNALVAANWAGAARRFFSEIVVPVVVPTAFLTGEAAFQAAMFALMGPPGLYDPGAALAAGFSAFAVVIAASAVVPVAVPPPAPLTLTPGVPTADPVGPATNLATAVFTWAKTGLYGVPPVPPLVPWS
ncbi:hypothetical protein Rctr197k_075 [Virus Rctr197k]|nr:hypothetical protein Rctr197k_075 [Virus Rctr197k]